MTDELIGVGVLLIGVIIVVFILWKIISRIVFGPKTAVIQDTTGTVADHRATIMAQHAETLRQNRFVFTVGIIFACLGMTLIFGMTWLEFLDHRAAHQIGNGSSIGEGQSTAGATWPRLLTPILGGFIIEAVAVLFTVIHSMSDFHMFLSPQIFDGQLDIAKSSRVNFYWGITIAKFSFNHFKLRLEAL